MNEFAYWQQKLTYAYDEAMRQERYGQQQMSNQAELHAFRMKERYDLLAEVERLRSVRGCLLAGPGRGDCENFIGLPKIEDKVDEYGRPFRWCEVCWRGAQRDAWRNEARKACVVK